MNKKYLVVWAHILGGDGRIGSVDLTPENLQHFKDRFCMQFIQRDMTGTEHWRALGPLPKKRKAA